MYSKEERPQETFGQKDLLFHDEPIILQGEYAGFWLRFVAAVLDGILLNVAGIIINSIFGISGPLNWSDQFGYLSIFSIMMNSAFGFVLNMVYFSLMESSEWQATIGKRVVGLKVTNMQGSRINFLNALARNLAKIISTITFFIGYIMAGFTEKKQALHDLIAGTLVIKT